ncbi:histidine kinase [Yaniella flava]|uniref:histidine kinase n=1 Tax=Yaniella flava TaxID=287930 RepID=A0ABP5GEU9_9MICC
MTVHPFTRFAVRHKTSRPDLLTALALLALGLVLLGLGVNASSAYPVLIPFSQQQLHWWHTIPLVLACLATCVQSRYPLGVFYAITALFIADMVLGFHLVMLIAWANTAYNAARYAAGSLLRWSLVGFGVMTFGLVYLVSGSVSSATNALLQVVLTAVIAVWWGSEVRRGDESTEAERLKSLAARRQEEHEREQLLRRQRADLASQLHDTISSHLSTIALYTAGALDMSPNAQRDRSVLMEVRRSSLDALTDMRELIDVLRTFANVEAEDTGTAPPLAWQDMLRRLRSAGLELSMTAESERHVQAALTRSDSSASLLLAKVLQEALTNALKHGDGTATMHCEATTEGITCTITNPLAPSVAPDAVAPSQLSGGLGLGAMAGAVHDADGIFSAAATRDGVIRHWTVHIELPFTAPPSPSLPQGATSR